MSKTSCYGVGAAGYLTDRGGFSIDPGDYTRGTFAMGSARVATAATAWKCRRRNGDAGGGAAARAIDRAAMAGRVTQAVNNVLRQNRPVSS